MLNEELRILASEQFGLFTTSQAEKFGVSRVDVHRLAKRHEIRNVRRGVYSTSPVSTDPHEEVRAAWLALDPSKTVEERLRDDSCAVLGVSSAAEIYGWGNLPTYTHEFFVPKRKQTNAEDIHLRKRQLPESDTQILHGLKVTTPTRTVIDLLAEGEELEHIGDVLTDAVRAQSAIDWKRIREASNKYEKIYGLTGQRIFAELSQAARSPEEKARYVQSLAASVSPELSQHINQQLGSMLSNLVNIKLPKVAIPLVNLPRFQLPAVEVAVPKIEVPTVDLSKVKAIEDLNRQIQETVQKAVQEATQPFYQEMVRINRQAIESQKDKEEDGE